MNQDDNIIRIYRRDRQNPRMVVGTVEQVGEKKKMWFTDFEELRRIMGAPRSQTPRRGQNSRFEGAERTDASIENRLWVMIFSLEVIVEEWSKKHFFLIWKSFKNCNVLSENINYNVIVVYC